MKYFRSFNTSWRKVQASLKEPIDVKSSRIERLSSDIAKQLQPLVCEAKLCVDVTTEVDDERYTTYYLLGNSEAVRTYVKKLTTEATKTDTKTDILRLKKHELELLKLERSFYALKEGFFLKDVIPNYESVELKVIGRTANVCQACNRITNLREAICTEKVEKRKEYLRLIEQNHIRQTVLEKLNQKSLKVVCDSDQQHIIAHAFEQSLAKSGLKCIEEVLWECRYPENRQFSEEEKEFVGNSSKWKAFRSALEKEIDSLRILDNSDHLIVIGFKSDLKQEILKRIGTFLDEHNIVSTAFTGEDCRIMFLKRYLRNEIEQKEKSCGVKISMAEEDFSITGSKSRVKKCEEQLRNLHDSLKAETHSVNEKRYIQVLRSDSEILRDVGARCGTLVINEERSVVLSDRNKLRVCGLVNVEVTKGSIEEVQV